MEPFRAQSALAADLSSRVTNVLTNYLAAALQILLFTFAPPSMRISRILVVLFLVAEHLAFGFETPPSADRSLTAAQVEDSPSEQAFRLIFGVLEQKAELTPLDYRIAAEQMVELCEDFPNSAAALRCVATAKAWSQRSLAPPEVLAPLLAASMRLNPAREELADLQKTIGEATAASDIATLREAIPRLVEIASRHPDTISEYLAKAILPSLYRQVGQNEQALLTAKEFLESYPPSVASGYPSYSHYQYVNTFQFASMQAKLSVDEALATYEKIAADNPTNAMYAVSALWDAGNLAFQHQRYEEAKRFFRKLSSDFTLSDDRRSRTAEYKVLEILHLQGSRDEGLALADELRSKYSNEPYWVAMADEFSRLLKGERPVLGAVTKGQGADKSAPVTQEQRSIWWLLLWLNICVFAGLGAILTFRRWRSAK